MCGDITEPSEGAWEPASPSASLPTATRAYTALRLALLDKALQRVLGLAATADASKISLSQLRAGAAPLEPPLTIPTLYDALDRAVRMRLLEERDGCYSFWHPLVGAALYRSRPRHRRDEFRAALVQPGRTAC